MLLFIIIFSIVHSSLINHWLPVSVLVRSYQVPFKKSLLFFAGTALAHNISTLVFSYLAARLGMITEERVEGFVVYASLILVFIGLYYIFTYKKEHAHYHGKESKKNNESFWLIYSGILLNMFFSPCIDVTIIFFSISSKLTISTVLLYCFTYFTLSVGGMLIFMGLSHRGLALIPFQKIEKYSRLVFGVLFILMAVFSLYGDSLLDEYFEKIDFGNSFEN